jgi:hypothetical protein
MSLTRFLEDLSSLLAYCIGGSTVGEIERLVFDDATEVPVVITVDKPRHPVTCLVFAGKWPTRVVEPIFACSK